MKSVIFYLLLFLIILSCSTEPNINSNYGWTSQSDQQDDINYNAIYFADEEYGWIIGTSGTIKKSADGGETWVSQTSNVQSELWDVCFVNNQIGWSCGGDNSLLKTTDGGENWNKIELSGSTNIFNIAIEFIDTNNGWMSNNQGELLKTTDGGLDWKIVKQGNLGGARLKVFDENTVYAWSGKLYKTLDGGLTWDSLDVPYSHNYYYWVMSFPDPDHGFLPTINGTGGTIINEYPIMITNDGGKYWYSSDSLKSESSLGFTTVFFTDHQNGWVAGREIYRTQNGGNSWALEFSGIIASNDMYFVNENCGWLITRSGQVYKYGEN